MTITQSDIWAKATLVASLNHQFETAVTDLNSNKDATQHSPYVGYLLRRAYQQSSGLSATLSNLSQVLQEAR